jgi:hypothetical protein
MKETRLLKLLFWSLSPLIFARFFAHFCAGVSFRLRNGVAYSPGCRIRVLPS